MEESWRRGDAKGDNRRQKRTSGDEGRHQRRHMKTKGNSERDKGRQTKGDKRQKETRGVRQKETKGDKRRYNETGGDRQPKQKPAPDKETGDRQTETPATATARKCLLLNGTCLHSRSRHMTANKTNNLIVHLQHQSQRPFAAVYPRCTPPNNSKGIVLCMHACMHACIHACKTQAGSQSKAPAATAAPATGAPASTAAAATGSAAAA